MFSPCLREFSQSTPDSSYSPENMHLIGDSKIELKCECGLEWLFVSVCQTQIKRKLLCVTTVQITSQTQI